METDLIKRECNNCTYYPCLRVNCGEVCDKHKTEVQEMLKEIDKKLTVEEAVRIIKEEGYQDWEGMR